MLNGTYVAYAPNPLAYGKGRVIYTRSDMRVVCWWDKLEDQLPVEQHELVRWDLFLNGGVPVLSDDDFSALTG